MELKPEEIMELTLEEITELTDKQISVLYQHCSSTAKSIVNTISSNQKHQKDYNEFAKEYVELTKKYSGKSLYTKTEYIEKRFTAKLLAKALYIFDYKSTKSPTEVLGLYLCRYKLKELYVYPNRTVYGWEIDVTIGDINRNIPLTIDIHGKRTHASAFQKARDTLKRTDLAQKGMCYLVFQGTDLVHNMSNVENKIKEALTEEYAKVNSIYLFKNRYNNNYSPKRYKKA
ncbi:hypothetical protein [Bacillus cereus]